MTSEIKDISRTERERGTDAATVQALQLIADYLRQIAQATKNIEALNSSDGLY